MAWKDKLRPASFRGVPFFVDTSQFTSGRRAIMHEFPDRDSPYTEDLGRVGRTFKVEGHILGDDYFETKQNLLNAVDTFGPGELIHPYYGTLLVQCGAFSIDEDTKEGRIAKISFQFYEAGDNTYPKAVDDKQAQVADKTASAKEASKNAFDSVYSIAKAPGHVVDSARAQVNKAADTFKTATKGVVLVAEETANLAYGIRNLKAEVNDLMKAPEQLSKRLQDNFELLKKAIASPIDRKKAVSSFSNFGKDVPPVAPTTPNRVREQQNTDALNNLLRRTATADEVEQATLSTYDSTDSAVAERERLSGQIEELLLNSSDSDDVFSSFEDLNAAMVRVLPDDDSNLPNIQTVSTTETGPSLVLAYDVFETPDAESDLITRNAIRHPGFVPGGIDLKVLDVRQGA